MSKGEFIRGNIVHVPTPESFTVIERGYIYLADGFVKGLFREIPDALEGLPVRDYGDALITQSFADMHLHGPQYAMLGMGMDLQLLRWLENYTFKTEARFSDPDYARDVYRRLARELVNHGTTRVAAFGTIHVDSTLIMMEEFEKAGLSGYVGKVNMDRHGAENLQEETLDSISSTVEWLEKSGDFKSIRPILTPRFAPTCTPELLGALKALCKEQDLPLQTHLSENIDEIKWVSSLFPECAQYWEVYDRFELMGPTTLLAHCVYSDRRERTGIRRAGSYVVHCPDSNVNLVSGIAPIRTMLREKVNVVLGSDIAGGSILSMLGVMASAIRASKYRAMQYPSEEPLTVSEAFYLGTTAASRYFYAGDGFAEGEKFHAVVIDDSDMVGTASLSIRERIERAVYLAEERHIVAVYGEGKLLKDAAGERGVRIENAKRDEIKA